MHSHFRRFLILAAIVAGFGKLAVAGDFNLLVLDGAVVKWGEPRLGAGASLTYAFATQRYVSPGARNCSDMDAAQFLSQRAGFPDDVLERETRAAFRAWEAVADLHFTQVSDPQTADIVIGIQHKPRGYAFTNVRQNITGSSGSTVAQQTSDRGLESAIPFPEMRTEKEISTISKALVCFNADKRWKVDRDGNIKVYDIRYTLMHEIGHAIGLDHSGRRGLLMDFRYTEAFRSPQPGDVEGAQLLYGPAKER